MLLYSKPVLASIQAPPSIQPGAELPVGFQLEKLKRVATVSFVFERDAALTGGTTEDKNGFTALYSTCISNPTITKRVTEGVQPGSIILFHNAALHTPEALPGILEYLLGEGYQVVPVGQLILPGTCGTDYTIDHTGRQMPAE